MRNIPAALQTHIEGEVTSLTRCLKITKTNGEVLRITEHDNDIVVNGDTYFTGVPMESSAIQSTDTLAVDNAEITLGYADGLVDRDDFDDGLYDEAAFELFLVNWEDPTDGVIYLKRGTLGAITFNDENSVTVQLRGLTQKLQKSVVEKYSPTCRVNLGGAKCGVVNVPTRIRRNRQRVKTFDWFLVPFANITTPVISNLSFEVDLSGWTTPSGSDWDRDNAFTAGAGTWYVVGGAPGGLSANSGYEMSFYRDLGTLADLGMANVDVDDGDYSIDFSALIALANAANPNPGKVFVEQFDSVGRTLKRTESEYITPEFQTWQGTGVTEFVIPGCRTIRFGLMNRIDYGTQGYVAFDDLAIRFWTNEMSTFNSKVFRTMRLPLPDPQEAFAAVNGTPVALSTFPDPPTAQNITDAWYCFDLRFAAPATFDIDFMDDTATPILTVSFVAVTRGIHRVPSGTTRIRYTSASTHSAAYLFVTAYESEVDAEYDKLANAQPTYDYDANDYTVDGAALVQARSPVFAFTTVTGTVDERTFLASGINQTAARMFSGKIVWISGANAGKVSFIRIWDNTAKQARLYGPLRGTITVGDKFVYAIGCDKLIATCADVFGNAHNFRGEPYLPGPNRVIEFMTTT